MNNKLYGNLIFELSKEGRRGYSLPDNRFGAYDIPAGICRKEDASLPECDEMTVVRHYTNHSANNFGVNNGFYPLGSCTMKYNPKVNEKLANLDGFLNLHPALKDEDGSVYFSVENDLGTKVESCALCDTIEYLKIKRSNPKSLCAVTNFNLESCAETDSISYVVTQKSKTTEGICTPSLVYFGRTGDILKFAINDCSTISKPTLSYDLKLGDTVRFLDEQIKVVSADNLGIYYSPLSKPTLKNNDVVDAKVTATLLKSKKLQLQECKTLENEQEHTETAKTSTLDSAKLKDSDTAQTNSTQNTDNSQVNRAKTN